MIIRELPSWGHINYLVHAFFRNVAWHYDIVDEATFLNQLRHWRSLSYNQLKEAPQSLTADLWSFPALLFQVLAQSLLFQPLNHDDSLNDLKYAANMNLSDRAVELSDAGLQLDSLVGKRKLTLTTIQAGLLRASFEKNTGKVVEAWHSVGVAIRNGQELGLHLGTPEPMLTSEHQNPADHSLGCRIWLMLHLWDAHMAVVLGRPMMTRLNPSNIPLPASWSHSPIEQELLQPRDVILCGFHTAYKYLQDIPGLEKKDNGFLLVEEIHKKILANIANLPAWATPQRSRLNESAWLSAALETMFTNVHFVLLALHRPFVFSSASSRSKAYYFATQIMESQARLFDRTEPLQYKSFELVYSTFDATVLIAATHIRFTDEFSDQFPAAKRNLEWGLDRLRVLQSTNDLASPAFNVIQQLYQKMLASVCPSQSLPSSSQGVEGETSVGSESELFLFNWDAILQPVENTMPGGMFNEIICDGAFGFPSGGHRQSFVETDYLPLELHNY
ncbi:hypothetical protein C7974DRAFT_194868 [Boeremia exigua]|uniref:uncharacterized protein n=1 Tax=Boeremia exigua TaxID=749465 RepID=UPI001E8D506D|nr:uncharacterized protein C7974DRAFT_194868 [Boeremia exigua]KAH6625099.1 hypothetical protein C7974DRAFT_194868 [Boeremia exigua]